MYILWCVHYNIIIINYNSHALICVYLMAEQEYPNAVIIHFLVSTKCITVQFMYFNYKVIIIVMVYMPTVICRHQTVI